jgi:hypothetical protein
MDLCSPNRSLHLSHSRGRDPARQVDFSLMAVPTLTQIPVVAIRWSSNSLRRFSGQNRSAEPSMAYRRQRVIRSVSLLNRILVLLEHPSRITDSGTYLPEASSTVIRFSPKRFSITDFASVMFSIRGRSRRSTPCRARCTRLGLRPAHYRPSRGPRQLPLKGTRRGRGGAPPVGAEGPGRVPALRSHGALRLCFRRSIVLARSIRKIGAFGAVISRLFPTHGMTHVHPRKATSLSSSQSRVTGSGPRSTKATLRIDLSVVRENQQGNPGQGMRNRCPAVTPVVDNRHSAALVTLGLRRRICERG